MQGTSGDTEKEACTAAAEAARKPQAQREADEKTVTQAAADAEAARKAQAQREMDERAAAKKVG